PLPSALGMPLLIATFVHLAPRAPWVWLALGSLALLSLGLWAYRFVMPPLPALARRALPVLRMLALLVLLWLLAQPVIERARGHVGERRPVRVRLSGSGSAAPLVVRLFDQGREIAHAQVPAPSSGAEATVQLLATPTRPGLALWTATVDSVAGEITTGNNAR